MNGSVVSTSFASQSMEEGAMADQDMEVVVSADVDLGMVEVVCYRVVALQRLVT